MNDLDKGAICDLIEDDYDDEMVDYIEDKDNECCEGAIEDMATGEDTLLEEVIPAIEDWNNNH